MLWRMAKRTAFVVALVLTSPLILVAGIESVGSGRRSERIYGGCKELLATVPTLLGQYLRSAFYWASCESVSWDVCLLLGAMIAHRGTVVGRRVVVGSYSIIGLARIEDDVLIGSRASIVSGKFQHGRPRDRAGARAGTSVYETIRVGRNSWIGEGAVILASVGTNCTIAAGSVLAREAPDGSTFVGNPARRVDLVAPASPADVRESRT